MSNLTWEEPTPSAGGGRGRQSSVFTEEVQEALKDNPGKWAVLIPEASASAVSNAQAWSKKRPGFQVSSRTVVEQKGTKTPFKVYARFNPDKVAEDEARIAMESERKAAAKKSEEESVEL